MKKKEKLGRKLLGFLLTLVMVVGLMPGMSLTVYAAWGSLTDSNTNWTGDPEAKNTVTINDDVTVTGNTWLHCTHDVTVNGSLTVNAYLCVQGPGKLYVNGNVVINSGKTLVVYLSDNGTRDGELVVNAGSGDCITGSGTLEVQGHVTASAGEDSVGIKGVSLKCYGTLYGSDAAAIKEENKKDSPYQKLGLRNSVEYESHRYMYVDDGYVDAQTLSAGDTFSANLRGIKNCTSLTLQAEGYATESDMSSELTPRTETKTVGPISNQIYFYNGKIDDMGCGEYSPYANGKVVDLWKVVSNSEGALVLTGYEISHTHTIGEETITFTAWNGADSLPTSAGNYYLTQDVTTVSTWAVPAGTTNICLNGHGIRYAGSDNASVITVGEGAMLCLYDCDTTTKHYITLDGNGRGTAVSDTTSEGAVEVTGGYLTGGTGATNDKYGGGVYINAGTFTMYGGTITGNTATRGGGVGVNYSDTQTSVFNMEGGTIKNNTAIDYGGGVFNFGSTINLKGGEISDNAAIGSSYGYGGGVSNSAGTFNMSGGTIKNNTANLFGGVRFDSGTFTMTGGEIVGNNATSSIGGVYAARPINISGKVTIKGNTVDGKESNIHLQNYDGYTNNPIVNVTDALDSTSSIGVTMYTPGVFTNSTGDNKAKNYLDNFTSDDAAYSVEVDGDELKLVQEPPVASVTVGDNTTEYSNFETALNAWVDGSTLKLLADVETNSTITIIGKKVTLDLNGYGICYLENAIKYGSVIRIGSVYGSALTLIDSDAAKQSRKIHYITLDENGRGTSVSDNGTESENCIKVTGGYITGGYGEGDAHRWGGAVYVTNGTFTMEGGTIAGNTAIHMYTGSGAGVYVDYQSTFNLNGGTISNNKASGTNGRTEGGGVYVGGTFNLSGEPVITGNAGGNVYLENGKVINVKDGLSLSAPIGVTMKTPEVFTSGAQVNDNDAARALFTSDNSAYTVEATENKEAKLVIRPVTYIDHDENGNPVSKVCQDYKIYEATRTNIPVDTWYVVNKDTVVNDRITTTAGGDCKLIICDGATLTAEKGITVDDGKTLNIYAGSMSDNVEGTGTLIAQSESNVAGNKTGGGAGIGGEYLISTDGDTKNAGNINIHGGNITARGGYSSAGIGGGFYHQNVSSYGQGGTGGNVTIYDGTVTAIGMRGAGIGGGFSAPCGVVTINGGSVTANGGDSAAGIGGGNVQYGNPYTSSGTVIINGGTVIATGHSYGGAGIGGGYKGNGATVKINNGTVITAGSNGGMGIGMGYGGTGTVNGSLTLGEGMNLYGGTSESPENNLDNHLAGEGEYEGDRCVYMTVNNVAPHTHNFTYTVSGNIITATCNNDGCNLSENPMLTLVKPAKTIYGDENSAEATVDGLEDFLAATGLSVYGNNIRYYDATKSGDTYTKAEGEYAGVPDKAGDYVAEITLGSETEGSFTASVGYSIAKAEPTATAPTGLTATYGQTLADVSLENKNPEGNTAGTWTWVDDTVNVGSVGEHTFKANFTPAEEEAENYKSVKNVDVKVTVGKADNPARITNTAFVKKGGNIVDLSKNITMNGATGDVIYEISGEAKGCTMNGSVLTSGQNTGSVTVNVTVAADDNYNASAAMSITVTISDKGTQTITASDVIATYGDTNKKVEATTDGNGAISYAVKDGGNVIDVDISTGVLTIKNAGTATVVVTAAETGTYVQATKEVTVTINKANVVAATVTANNRTYDGKEKPLVNVDNSTLLGGEMQYALGTATETTQPYTIDIPSATNVGTYYVWYKAVGDENHSDSVPACVSVVIGSKESVEGEVTFNKGEGSDETPKTVVESVESSDLTEFAETQKEEGKEVKVELEITPVKAEEVDPTSVNGTKQIAEGLFVGFDADQVATEYFEIDIKKYVNNEDAEIISDTKNPLEITLTYDKTKMSDPVVVRTHNGETKAFDKLSARPAEKADYKDATYYIGDGVIYLYSQFFSDYAIIYSTVKTYNVVIVTGTSDKISKTVAKGSKVDLPTGLSKSGYTFSGWYSDEAYTKVWNANDPVTADTTIYAKWTKNTAPYVPSTPVETPTPTPTATPTPTETPTVTPTPVKDSITAEEAARGAIKLNAGLKVYPKKSDIVVKWGKVDNADRYVIYAAYCKKGRKCAKIATLDGDVNSYKFSELNGKPINTKKNIKLYVVAYRKVNGKYKKITRSITAHIVGSGSKKYSNVKGINVENTKITLSLDDNSVAPSSITLKPTAVLKDSSKKMLRHTAEFRYATSKSSVATVGKDGTITAKGIGTCYIYVYAQNGYAKKVKVTVK